MQPRDQISFSSCSCPPCAADLVRWFCMRHPYPDVISPGLLELTLALHEFSWHSSQPHAILQFLTAVRVRTAGHNAFESCTVLPV